MATAEVRRYWAKLTALGCAVCGGKAEIAHCHSGSIVERMHEPKAKGKKLPRYDWLVLPLCPPHHRHGAAALDNGVKRWERENGAQADHIDRLSALLEVDVWAKAKEGAK